MYGVQDNTLELTHSHRSLCMNFATFSYTFYDTLKFDLDVASTYLQLA